MSKSKRAKARRRQQAASPKAVDRAAVVATRRSRGTFRFDVVCVLRNSVSVRRPSSGVCASMGLARVTYAGHSKHAIKTLAIPQPLYEVVRKNLLAAGILAPATAPPDAATSTS